MPKNKDSIDSIVEELQSSDEIPVNALKNLPAEILAIIGSHLFDKDIIRQQEIALNQYKDIHYNYSFLPALTRRPPDYYAQATQLANLSNGEEDLIKYLIAIKDFPQTTTATFNEILVSPLLKRLKVIDNSIKLPETPGEHKKAISMLLKKIEIIGKKQANIFKYINIRHHAFNNIYNLELNHYYLENMFKTGQPSLFRLIKKEDIGNVLSGKDEKMKVFLANLNQTMKDSHKSKPKPDSVFYQKMIEAVSLLSIVAFGVFFTGFIISILTLLAKAVILTGLIPLSMISPLFIGVTLTPLILAGLILGVGCAISMLAIVHLTHHKIITNQKTEDYAMMSQASREFRQAYKHVTDNFQLWLNFLYELSIRNDKPPQEVVSLDQNKAISFSDQSQSTDNAILPEENSPSDNPNTTFKNK